MNSPLTNVARRGRQTLLFAAPLAIAALFLSAPAQAALMSLGVDSGASSFSAKLAFSGDVFSIPVSFSTPSISATLSGAAPPLNTVPPATTGFLGDLAVAGSSPGTPGNLKSDGGGFAFTNLSTTLNGPNLGTFGTGSVTLGLVAPLVTIAAGGNFPPLTSGPGTATYDFSGLPLTLNGGIFSYSSAGYLSFIGSGSVNFLSNITTVNLPSGSIGSITLGAGPPNNEPVTLTIPLTMTIPLFHTGDTFLGASLDALINGNLVLTGFISVPEPSSIALLGVGCAVAVPLLARRFRRK